MAVILGSDDTSVSTIDVIGHASCAVADPIVEISHD